jgi:hypothetical protein
VTDQRPPAKRINLAPTVFAFDITYADQTAHTVRTRPGDITRMEDEFGGAWLTDPSARSPKHMQYLAWLASRHDPTGLARPDFDTFRDDAVSIEVEVIEVDPTDAAPGRGSPSSLPSPPVRLPVDGSTPIPAPL